MAQMIDIGLLSGDKCSPTLLPSKENLIYGGGKSVTWALDLVRVERGELGQPLVTGLHNTSAQ